MSRPAKIAVLFLITLLYACISWAVFHLQVSIASTGFWLWLTSLALIIGAGFRVITNKFFGSFFVSYLMFGIAGLILLLWLIMKIASLPIFNKEAYIQLANITVAEFSDYSMTDQDFKILPKSVASRLAADYLATQIDEDSGFLMMGGDLQSVDGILYYVFSLDHEDQKTESPGFLVIDAKTGDCAYHETNVPMAYSPYRSDKNNILYCIAAAGGQKNAIVEHRLELDDNMVPWWVSYEYKPAVSFMGGKALANIYLTNPYTGGSIKYSVTAIPSWLDYKVSLDLTVGIFNTAADLSGMNVSIDTSSVMILPRGNQLYAYYNLKTEKEHNGGVVFLNLKTGSASAYLQETVQSERVMECLNAWEISSEQQTVRMPVLTNTDDTLCFVSPTYSKDGTFSGYIMIDAIGGSAYGIGKTWEETLANFKSVGNSNEKESTTNPEPSIDPPVEEGEGITYNLIAGLVESYTSDGTYYVVTLAAMKPKYYIEASLITTEELEEARTGGIALQYPIEYEGQMEVRSCIPVDMSVMYN